MRLVLTNSSVLWFSLTKESEKDSICATIERHWKKIKESIEEMELYIFDSYKDLLTKALDPGFLNQTKIIVVFDVYYISTLLLEEGKKSNINYVDIETTKDFYFQPYSNHEIQTNISKYFSTFSPTNSLESYSVNFLKPENLNLYKKILKTYNKVIFFDPFNTFKYKLDKNLRKNYEDVFYKFFGGIISRDEFMETIYRYEKLLKPSQLIRYKQVKDYIESGRADILLALIKETDDTQVKLKLKEHSLDYFDLNYLRDYLVNYGKPKGGARKKHNLKLANDGENFVNVSNSTLNNDEYEENISTI